MRNFNNFINESNEERETMIQTIYTILREVEKIDCNIIFNTTQEREYRIVEIVHVYDKWNTPVETVNVRYYINNYYNSLYLHQSTDNFITIIYNYLKENLPEYDYLFSGKDFGLL